MNSHNEPYIDINLGDSHIRLIGTAHVSEQSKIVVADEINSGNYQCIALELCDSRLEQIKNPDFVINSDIFQIIKSKKVITFVVMLAMSVMQNRIASKLGVEVGLEMKESVRLAEKNKLTLIPIDRSISITFARLTQNLGFIQRVKLILDITTNIFEEKSITHAEIESLKTTDALENMISEISNNAPLLHHYLIKERDEYMGLKLKELAKTHTNILAVVGAAHLTGIKEHLQKAQVYREEDIAALNSLPEKISFLKFFSYLILILIISGFFYGFYQSPELGMDLILAWFLINGGLSALFVLFSRAHFLSTVTAFFAAPLTSLNPTVGAGMIVGLVEAWLRKPKVSDFLKLKSDIDSIKGWFTNNVTRVLIVSFLAGLGSALGTYIAGYYIYGKLF